MVTRSKAGIFKPKVYHLSLDISKLEHDIPIEPLTVQEAKCSKLWLTAMQQEIATLDKNRTWELVPKHKAQGVIGCKWVFKVKLHSNGSLERCKARLGL